MNIIHKAAVLAFSAAAICTPLLAQSSDQATDQARAATLLQQPIAIERKEDATRVPLIPFMGKYAIDAQLDGTTRRFIFDTGSPTLISTELARELNLQTIGMNTGRDANGRAVTTQIAIVDELVIGGVTFRSVPVLIADFSEADPDGCFITNGVIGSEILPGSAWHIDAEQDELQIAASHADLNLPDRDGETIRANLHDFGYPHAPIVDYGFGSFSDKALFDTGNSETIVLFDRVLGDAQNQDAIASGTMRQGLGSHGVSAGGLGAQSDLFRFEIEGLELGDVVLGRQPATTRSAPPSLIGLGILATHNVTLDYPGEQMILTARSEPQERPRHAGYSLMTFGDRVEVMQLFEGSDAAKAGLQLGDHIVAIDGRDVSTQSAPCETTNWMVETRPTRDAKQITALRDGERVVIALDGN